jgi:adenosylcobinamide-phosphate synthase
VLTIALISRQPRHVWHLCQRDAPQDPSPNAGWSECAYAAALNVQMGGLNYYRGLAKLKPLLGNPNHAITPEKVNQALKLTRFSFLLWLTFAVLIWLLVQLVNQPF